MTEELKTKLIAAAIEQIKSDIEDEDITAIEVLFKKVSPEDLIAYLDDEKVSEFRDFTYYINLDERGEFKADVRNPEEKTVFEIEGFEVFEDGYMDNKEDLQGLREHLISLNIMPREAKLLKGN